jgi:hypothetical protein
MIKLINILKEAMFVDDKGNLVEDKRWAIYLDDKEDWAILSNILNQKGYKFSSGQTFSKYKLTDFNPFKSERNFGDEGEDDNDLGYSYAMSYQGVNDFYLLEMPNKKLQIVDTNYFDSRKNSTYRKYTVYNNLGDLIKVL